MVSLSRASLEGELIAERELEGKVLHVITIDNLQHAEVVTGINHKAAEVVGQTYGDSKVEAFHVLFDIRLSFACIELCTEFETGLQTRSSWRVPTCEGQKCIVYPV